MAARRSATQEVRDFADRIVRDQTMTTQKLAMVLQTNATPVVTPAALDPRHVAMNKRSRGGAGRGLRPALWDSTGDRASGSSRVAAELCAERRQSGVAAMGHADLADGPGASAVGTDAARRGGLGFSAKACRWVRPAAARVGFVSRVYESLRGGGRKQLLVESI